LKDLKELKGLMMINKRSAISMLKNFGDAIIEFKDRREPILCTIEFNNKYIKKEKRDIKQNLKGGILIFDWTNYKYDIIKVNEIYSITALSDILQNNPPEEIPAYHHQFNKVIEYGKQN
jgi:hypothetical protein